jgi:hypothetical protein
LTHNTGGYLLRIVINKESGIGFSLIQGDSQCAKERRNNADILHIDADQADQ